METVQAISLEGDEPYAVCEETPMKQAPLSSTNHTHERDDALPLSSSPSSCLNAALSHDIQLNEGSNNSVANRVLFCEPMPSGDEQNELHNENKEAIIEGRDEKTELAQGELGGDWKEAQTEEGYIYYYNASTGETKWAVDSNNEESEKPASDVDETEEEPKKELFLSSSQDKEEKEIDEEEDEEELKKSESRDERREEEEEEDETKVDSPLSDDGCVVVDDVASSEEGNKRKRGKDGDDASSAKKRRARLTPEEKAARELELAAKKKLFEESKKQREEKKRIIEEEKKQRKAEEERKREEKRLEEERKKEERRLKEIQLKEQREEKRKKEEEEKLEKKRKEEEEKVEKKKKEEEEKEKKLNEKGIGPKQAAFMNMFLKKSTPAPVMAPQVLSSSVQSSVFQPFELGKDMRIAPIRVAQNSLSVEAIDQALTSSSSPTTSSLLAQIKARRGARPSLRSMGRKLSSSVDGQDDVVIVAAIPSSTSEEGDDNPPARHFGFKMKLLQFYEDHRPPYYGTFRKKSLLISGRRPFGQDSRFVDYEDDSEAEWESGDEEEGDECLSADDRSVADDVPNEEELENDGWLVPHGYLSDDEGVDKDSEDSEMSDDEGKIREEKEYDEEEETNKAQKRAAEKKIMKMEFERASLKIKPRFVAGCLWENDNVSVPSRFARCRVEILEEFDLDQPVIELVRERSAQKKKDLADDLKKDLALLIHGSHLGKDKLRDAFLETHNEAASKYLLDRYLTDKKFCTRERNIHGRLVRVVNPRVVEELGLDALCLPIELAPVVPETQGSENASLLEGADTPVAALPVPAVLLDGDKDVNTPTPSHETGPCPQDGISQQQAPMTDVSPRSEGQIPKKIKKRVKKAVASHEASSTAQGVADAVAVENTHENEVKKTQNKKKKKKIITPESQDSVSSSPKGEGAKPVPRPRPKKQSPTPPEVAVPPTPVLGEKRKLSTLEEAPSSPLPTSAPLLEDSPLRAETDSTPAESPSKRTKPSEPRRKTTKLPAAATPLLTFFQKKNLIPAGPPQTNHDVVSDVQ